MLQANKSINYLTLDREVFFCIRRDESAVIHCIQCSLNTREWTASREGSAPVALCTDCAGMPASQILPTADQNEAAVAAAPQPTLGAQSSPRSADVHKE